MPASLIKNIESKYNLEDIKLNQKSIWPILRIYYFFKSRDIAANSFENERQVLIKRILLRLPFVFKGFLLLIKSLVFFRNGVLVFSDGNELRNIDGLAKNKLFFSIFKKIDLNRILYFEKQISLKNKLPSDKPSPVSTAFIDMLAFGISFFVFKVKIDNESKILKIQKEFNIEINYKRILKTFIGYQLITKMIIKILKPKAILLSEYYNLFHMAICDSAADSQIPVIEFQHGVINSEHVAYNFYGPIFNSSYLPTHFSSFGSSFINALGDTSFIEKNKIFVSGHSYLSFLKEKEKDSSYRNKFSHYKTFILVTLQWTDEKEVIDFISKMATNILFENTLFVLLPRKWNENLYNKFKLPKNVIFEMGSDFYQLLKVVDIHVTTYSTTALEAPYFKKPNILLNFDDMSEKYFKDFIKDSTWDKYVKTQDEFILAYKSIISEIDFAPASRNIIEEENLDFILKLIETNNFK